MLRVILVAIAVLLAAPNLASSQVPGSPPDSLKVIICGSSGPLPISGRAKPCTAIQAGGALYLVDIGPEATENMMLWRIPVAKAKAVFKIGRAHV